jgi:phage gp16-like protein
MAKRTGKSKELRQHIANLEGQVTALKAIIKAHKKGPPKGDPIEEQGSETLS